MTSAAPERHPAVAPPTVALAVVAAHRVGQPSHPELVALGATFDRVELTAPGYWLTAGAGGAAGWDRRGGRGRHVGGGGAAQAPYDRAR